MSRLKNFINSFLKLLLILINPLSPITILFIGSLLQPPVITEDSNFIIKFLFASINDIKRATIVIYIWLFLAIFYMLYSTNNKEKQNSINQLSKELSNLQRLREHDAGVLLSKYDELSKFRYHSMLNEIAKKFTLRNSTVQTTQIYKYSIKTYKNSIVIKIAYQCGYACEKVDTNAIVQTYYRISNKRYREIIRIIDLWKKISIYEINDEDDIETLEKLVSKFEKFCDIQIGKIIKNLKRKIFKNKEFNDYDATMYGILIMLINMLFSLDYTYNETLNSTSIVLSDILGKSMDKKLSSMKRTGILCSILLKDAYMYKHKRQNGKNGRIYIWNNIELNKEQYVISMSLPPKEFVSHYEGQFWNKHIEDLKNDLNSLLKLEFEEEK